MGRRKDEMLAGVQEDTKVKRGIRFKLMGMFVIFIGLPLIIMGIMMYVKSKEILITNVEASSEQVIKEVENSISNYLSGIESVTKYLGEDSNVQQFGSNEDSKEWMVKTFDGMAKSNGDIMGIYLGTIDGEMNQRPPVDFPAGYDPRQRPWYKEAMTVGGFIWTEPYNDASSDELVITSAVPVKNTYQGNQAVGVVGLDISLKTIGEKANKTVVGKAGYISLISPSKVILTHPTADLVGLNMDSKGAAETEKELSPEKKAKNEEYRKSLEPIYEAITAMDQATDEIKKKEAFIKYRFDGKEKYAEIRKTEMGWYIVAALESSEIDNDAQGILIYLVILGSFALVISLVFSFIFANRMTKNVKIMLEGMEKVKNGDLTVRFQVKSKDELGKLGQYFTSTITELAGLIKRIQDIADEVTQSAQNLAATSEETSASADEVSKTVEEIARGASDQAQDAERGVRVVTALSEKFVLLNERTTKMIEVTQKVVDANQEGVKAIDGLKTKTVQTDKANDRIEGVITELDNKSQSIGAILDSISAIAVQTNLLALNASIEAARAGEHGRGFAVVAEEIRKLAEESSSAADEIRIIVTNILSDSTRTVSSMKEVKAISKEQSHAVEDVNRSFGTISGSIDMITEEIETITAFIQELNGDKNKIVQSIESISAVSEETAAASEEVSASMDQQTVAVEEVAKSAERLNEISVELNGAAKQFTV